MKIKVDIGEIGTENVMRDGKQWIISAGVLKFLYFFILHKMLNMGETHTDREWGEVSYLDRTLYASDT